MSRHPWEKARIRALRQILAVELSPGSKVGRVLDVGCGDGFTMAEIGRQMPALTIDAVDIQLSAARLAEFSQKYSQITFHNSYADLEKKSYDLITMFDVVEHVADDRGFLCQIMEYAAPEALLVLTVPAFPSLFGGHDRFLGHWRRYDRQTVQEVAAQAGLQVLGLGYFFSALLPLRLLANCYGRLANRAGRAGVGEWKHGALISNFVTWLLSVDVEFGFWLHKRGLDLPGLSLWIKCRPGPGKGGGASRIDGV